MTVEVRRALGLIVAGAALGEPALATQPNVLLIVADDMGVDKVGVYADDYPEYREDAAYLPVTTTLDELAASGLRFTSAWGTPLCSPARAALLTGRHAFRTGVGNTVPNGQELDVDAETTLADVLTDPSAGPEPYAAGLVGKWHLGFTGANGTYDWSIPTGDNHRDVDDLSSPLRAGFDEFRGTLAGHVGDYQDWERTTDKLRGQAAVDRTHAYATDVTTDDAVDWIHEQHGPWFLELSYHAPHTAEANGRYYYGDVPDGCHDVACLATGDCTQAAAALVAGMVECMDRSIETLLLSLPEEELDDTLIVFIGDNGTFDVAAEGGFAELAARTKGGKGTAYESGIAVPMLVTDGRNWREWHACSDTERAEGLCVLSEGLLTAPGREITSPVHTMDLFATLADATGFTQTTGTDSVSFYDCFADPSSTCATPTGERSLYTEAWDYTGEANGGPDSTVLSYGNAAMRRGSAKLVVTYDATARCLGRELYDLSADPYEWTDLAHDAAWAATLTDLSSAVRSLAPTWMTGKVWCP